MRTTDAVVFDIGKVLVRWDPHPAVAAAVGDAEATRFLGATAPLGPVRSSVAVLEELHEHHVPLFALTNWSTELFPHARERYDFLAIFDDIVVSGDEGGAKPDPAVFEILHRRIGHPLDRCVFIDDGPANVAAAADAGLDAILFTDTGRLRGDLRDRGLPLAAA